jgi:hypothetical protein
LAYVFAVFFKNVDLMGLGFCFEKCFEACFVLGDAWVGFARDDFFKDYLPGFHVSSHIVEGFSINLDVKRRVRRTIQNRVERNVPAQTMRKKQAANDAFVNYVESACIVEAAKV